MIVSAIAVLHHLQGKYRLLIVCLCGLTAVLGLHGSASGQGQGQGAATAVGNKAAGNKATAPVYAKVVPGHVLQFPRDHGSHPDFRTEWWYVTGWLTLPEIGRAHV